MLEASAANSQRPSNGKRQTPSVPFDFETVCERLDDPGAQLPSDDRAADLLKVVTAIAEWLYPHRSTRQSMAMRAYAYVFFLHPEWLGNPTQAELAKKLKVSKQSFGKVVNELRTQFGFYVSGMRHESAREKFSRNAKAAAPKLAAARKTAFNQKGK